MCQIRRYTNIKSIKIFKLINFPENNVIRILLHMHVLRMIVIYILHTD